MPEVVCAAAHAGEFVEDLLPLPFRLFQEVGQDVRGQPTGARRTEGRASQARLLGELAGAAQLCLQLPQRRLRGDRVRSVRALWRVGTESPAASPKAPCLVLLRRRESARVCRSRPRGSIGDRGWAE